MQQIHVSIRPFVVARCATTAVQATALAAELEALLAEERLENSEERPVVAGLESKPEEQQPESPETRQPKPAKKIVEPEESAETGDVSETPVDAETGA